MKNESHDIFAPTVNIITMESILSILILLLFPSNKEVSFSGLQFIELPERSIASCFVYELHGEGQKIDLSPELEELLECPPELPTIAPNEQFLVYVDGFWTAVKTYHLATGTTQEIMTFEEDSLGGISFQGWSPDKTKLAMVTVDWSHQQGPTLTKLHILTFETDTTLNNTTSYDIKINMSCSSANCAPAPEDLRWIDNSTIQYQTWDEVPYDLEGSGAFQRLTL